jgi:hypothetical protein
MNNYTIWNLSACITFLQQFLSKSNISDLFQLFLTVAIFIIIKLTVFYTKCSHVVMVKEHPHIKYHILSFDG